MAVKINPAYTARSMMALVESPGGEQNLVVIFGVAPSEPWAVKMVLCTEEEPITWEFDRELLRPVAFGVNGLNAVHGRGDVQAHRRYDDPKWVVITLTRGPGAWSHVTVALDAMRGFIHAADEAVPAFSSIDPSRVDDALTEILGESA